MKQMNLLLKTMTFNKKGEFALKKVMLSLFFILSFFISSVTKAQVLNGYKYFCALDQKIVECFEKAGFERINFEDVDELNREDKKRLLVVDIDVLEDRADIFIMDFMGDLIHQIRIKKSPFDPGMKTGISNQIKKLHYRYDPNVEINDYHPFCYMSEAQITDYLKSPIASPIEGIYKNYTPSNDQYRLAILKDKTSGTLYGIVLDHMHEHRLREHFFRGCIKMVLNAIDGNKYDVQFFHTSRFYKIFDTLAEYNNRMISFEIDNQGKYVFTKIFPVGIDTDSNVQQSTDSSLKGTGSGFIISGNVVATNFHVIENANNIKIFLNVNGTQEEYQARVLSTDKTNDLALLTIKDDKFEPLPPTPFRIANSSVDVGTSVFTMGYPLSDVLGNEVKITDGLISSKTGYKEDAVTYQISVPIQPGNSGGALFDKNGNLVGITNAGILAADNVGYAIKSSYLLNLIDSAPIDIPLPKGLNLSGKELPSIIKTYTPYIALIKVY